jgi:hypothetical protein
MFIFILSILDFLDDLSASISVDKILFISCEIKEKTGTEIFVYVDCIKKIVRVLKTLTYN